MCVCGWAVLDQKWLGRSQIFTFLFWARLDPTIWVGPKLTRPKVHYMKSGREL